MSESSPTKQLPIRTGMDVYSAYQDQYLGSVVAVLYGLPSVPTAPDDSPSPPAQPVGAVREPPPQPPETPVSPLSSRGSHVLGESLGPFPTASAGNTGPRRQSAANSYATATDSPPPEVAIIVVRPGRLGLFRRPLYVPVDAVRSLSMERLVLDRQREQIPASWRQRPRREGAGG